MSHFTGRTLIRITKSSAPTSVGSKMLPKKHQRSEEEVPSQHRAEELLQPVQLSLEPINETTLVIRTNRMPDNSVSSAPLIVKRIGGRIRKCSGCQKPITSPVEHFSVEFCFGRLEAYNYWNKTTKSYQSTVSTRHFHLNPACTKMSKEVKLSESKLTRYLCSEASGS